MNNYRPLGVPWLERFHINKYVKPYDARTEGRYDNPPEFDRLEVGQRVFVSPKGRYKAFVMKSLVGKYGFVEGFSDQKASRHNGRIVRVRLILTDEVISLRESAFSVAKSVDNP